ncbi:MAG: type II secretion system ATPase GspE [Deltaproteobacteria bacterium]|mgnify:CR=1 FL=1
MSSNTLNLSAKTGLKSMDRIEDADVDSQFLQKLPLAFVKKNLVFPLKKQGNALMVALSDPRSLYALEDIARACGMPVTPVVVPAEQILDAIHRFYERTGGSAEELISELHGESLDELSRHWDEPKDLIDLKDEAPIIKLLNSILYQAVKERASDIHIEPFEKGVDVRFRRDGVLYSIVAPPRVIHDALVSRVKIMSGLDIAEKRLPQDGRIRLLVAGKDVDVRVSIIPTAFGERVVLRLLDRKGGTVSLNELGLSKAIGNDIDALLVRTNGIMLVTGPTGSGKTTTLYACINRINTLERNVITIEDPIEYQLKGVGQIQVNAKIGLSFANGLRSILRQDPDVIMVGEIRDSETAEMAIQASLTGHIVLSTLHTNDAPSAVTRLVDMGVQQFLLSSTIAAVVAQRLVRVLCASCRQEYEPTEVEAEMFGGMKPASLFRPIGCAKCLRTGYSGQTGIFEFMRMDQEMRLIVLKNSDSTSIKAHAIKMGMKTLRDDGLSKASSGVTSLEEVIRVTHGE